MDLLSHRNGRRFLFGLLYFSEGAPIGFLWWVLPVVLARNGLSKAEIGALTGTLVLPWALKFLWAPLVDVVRGPRFGFRGWIVASQIAMVVTLVPLLWVDLADPRSLTLLLVCHACAAATQDVAIDGLAIRATPPGERGSLNGWMQAGMLIGRGVFGGWVLSKRDEWGDSGLVAALLISIAAVLPVHLAYRVPAEDGAMRRRWSKFGHRLGAAFRTRSTWLVLAFAATAGVAFEATGSLAGPFLVDRGFDDDQIAAFFGFPVVVCLALGALAGGRLSDRFGRRVTVAGAAVAVSALVASLAAVPDSAPGVSQAVLAGIYLAGGVFTAASYALFMDATDPRLGATQFSAFMGATNACESWSARGGGWLASEQGTPMAFLVAAVLGILVLPLLWIVRLVPGAPEARTLRDRR